ncbi:MULTISPECIES: hypothetical protein [Lysinibacillus]|uniref:Uncharacterized protein n=3 Tax=Lysinibacillus TaxID=400634 RepID=A0AAJ4ZUP1_LYSSH|nr:MULTISPECIES: hypothetical protein [Lysinibacillus]AHN21692.1 hypothetical protein T479_09775 [Lysinibacillus varians]MCS1384062.1 hypothetical protein [Lysinibacillus sphaericus]MED4542452.1 hypothetical protein [Lysinibacillus sphaericus]SUV16959.1 Uncharacterised protein [Lysinibacillus sphaericus]GEC84369.1 hypothetical protein LSP03_41120 [Lysinibacillus sphaericus]
MMLKNLEKLILSVNFNEAEKLYQKSDFEQFHSELISIAYDNRNMIYYTFLHYLIMKKETAELHTLAFSLFVNSLTPIEGAYHCALYHAQRAVELTNEQDAGDLENLLFLNIVPDKLVSDQEAIDICHKILALDPSNKIAKSSLKELQRKTK